MAYKDLSLADLDQKFGIANQRKSLFPVLEPLALSQTLTQALAVAQQLPVRSEKAKSELIVMPVLLEVRARNLGAFTIYSGEVLTADRKNGLTGECDFILAKDTGTFDLSFPIIQMVEAKRNEVERGVPQCAAQMVGAKLYNEQHGTLAHPIYGCVTTGDEWIFIKLEKNKISIDTRKYYLVEIGELLAVFQHILQPYLPKAQTDVPLTP